jgi:hypothetical protein
VKYVASSLSFQPVDAKLRECPQGWAAGGRASLCALPRRPASVPAPAAVSGCARSPLMPRSASAACLETMLRSPLFRCPTLLPCVDGNLRTLFSL